MVSKLEDQLVLLEKCRGAVAYVKKHVVEAYSSFGKSNKFFLQDRMQAYLNLIEFQEDLILQMEYAIENQDVEELQLLVNRFNGASKLIKQDAEEVVLEYRGLKPKIDKNLLH